MNRDRTLTALAVLLVAAIAAVIIYQHVVALEIRYGQPVLAADGHDCLLPVFKGPCARCTLVLAPDPG